MIRNQGGSGQSVIMEWEEGSGSFIGKRSVSPDGSHVVFGAGRTIWYYDPENGAVEKLFDLERFEGAEPRWNAVSAG